MSSPLSYVLPLRWDDDAGLDELTAYLRWLAPRVDLVVVDASPEERFAAHARAWRGLGRHVPPDPGIRCLNGKVRGVLTGLRHVRHDAVVLGDDDVRYDDASLARMATFLAHADLVRPQNVFRPLPWHARWDTGRILLNRAVGGDYPGTLGVRASLLRATRGYDGDVLFENLEIMRTIEAAGGRVENALDLFVERRPPTARHFWGQRVRQAYDDLAQPARLALFLSIGPAVAVALARRRPGSIAVGAAATVALAEAGRRRADGSRAFPPSSSWMAPVWVAERAVCSWLAVLDLVARGGVRYGDGVIRRAATPAGILRRRHAAVRRARRRGSPTPSGSRRTAA